MEANQGLKKIIDMVIDGSGIRDIGRVLKISPNTVTAVLKNRKICKTG
ncbi:MAG: hypothetical protein K2O36_02670, partial [Ruminococcus sp.]|nr:hypothetical protein [Ruminococcus sp.]